MQIQPGRHISPHSTCAKNRGLESMSTSSSIVHITQVGAQHSIELGELHFRSHAETFTEFAAPEWIKTRMLGDYTQYWFDYVRSQPITEITWAASIK